MGFGVWGLDLGFVGWGLGFGVCGFGFGVWGLGFRVRLLSFQTMSVVINEFRRESMGSEVHIGSRVFCKVIVSPALFFSFSFVLAS